MASDDKGPDGRTAPAPDDVSAFYWAAAGQGRLEIQRCASCKKLQYPPDVVCTFCQSSALQPEQVSGRGTVYALAEATRAFHPGFMDHLPYLIAMVELDDQPGLRLLTNIVDSDASSVSVGTPVEVVFERRGDVTLPQFRKVGA